MGVLSARVHPQPGRLQRFKSACCIQTVKQSHNVNIISNISVLGPGATPRWQVYVVVRGVVDTMKMHPLTPVSWVFYRCTHVPHLQVSKRSLPESDPQGMVPGSASWGWQSKDHPVSGAKQKKCLSIWHQSERWLQSFKKCSGVCEKASQSKYFSSPGWGQKMSKAWTRRGKTQLVVI